MYGSQTSLRELAGWNDALALCCCLHRWWGLIVRRRSLRRCRPHFYQALMERYGDRAFAVAILRVCTRSWWCSIRVESARRLGRVKVDEVQRTAEQSQSHQLISLRAERSELERKLRHAETHSQILSQALRRELRGREPRSGVLDLHELAAILPHGRNSKEWSPLTASGASVNEPSFSQVFTTPPTRDSRRSRSTPRLFGPTADSPSSSTPQGSSSSLLRRGGGGQKTGAAAAVEEADPQEALPRLLDQLAAAGSSRGKSKLWKGYCDLNKPL